MSIKGSSSFSDFFLADVRFFPIEVLLQEKVDGGEIKGEDGEDGVVGWLPFLPRGDKVITLQYT